MANGPISRHGQTYAFVRFSKPVLLATGQVQPRQQIADDPATGLPWAMLAVVEPLKSFELLMMPDALRSRGLVRIYTETLLTPTDEQNKLFGDRLTWNGYIYEVISRDDWTRTDLSHYKFLAGKIPNQ